MGMAAESTIEWEDGSSSCEAQFVRLAHPFVRLDVGPWLPIHAGLFYLYMSGKSDGAYSFLHALAVFFAILGHILTALAQHWSVHAWRRIAFRKVASPDAATHVYVRTVSKDARNVGSAKLPAAIVPLEALPHPNAQQGATIAQQTPAQDVASALQSLPSYRFLWRSVSYELRSSPRQPSLWCARSSRADLPTALPLATYADWAGGSAGWTAVQAERLTTKFGENVVPVPLPSFLTLMMEHATAPFFVFQVSCVGLWCLDEYVWYSLFTLFTLVAMEATLVFQRRTTAKQLRGMRPAPHPVWAYRAGAWRVLPSQALVPLDIISLSREGAQAVTGKEKAAADTTASSSVPCPADVLLLSGQAVVNEAMLTGESTPMVKEGVMAGQGAEGGKETCLDAFTEGSDRSHTRHVVYSGTAVITAHGEGGGKGGPKTAPPDRGALAVVLRTGAHTSQGELLGVILHSTERVSVADSEAFAFIGGMLIFALSAAWYVLTKGLEDPSRDRWKLGLHVIMIITTVVPPELPVELSMAVNMSLTGLLRKGIYCTEPARIPLAGQVGTVCMDKTGTLTSDTFRVQGVTLLPSTASERPLVIPHAPSLPAMTQLVLLGCHDLLAVQVRVPPPPKRPGAQPQAQVENVATVRTEYAGDPIEQAAHSALGWAVDGAGTARPLTGQKVGALESWGVLPDSAASASPAVRVLHRWPFTSALKRMTCAVQVNAQGLEAIRQAAQATQAGKGERKVGLDAVPTGQVVLVTKGAPEIVEKLLATVPPGYASTQAAISAKGSRVLALAYRVLPPGTTTASLSSMSRGQAEQGLSFAGFLACSSPLKTDSSRVVKELQEAHLRCCMITGDSPLTALAVAAQLGMQQEVQGTSAAARPAVGSSAVMDLSEQGTIVLSYPLALAQGRGRGQGAEERNEEEQDREGDMESGEEGATAEAVKDTGTENPAVSEPAPRSAGIDSFQDVREAVAGLSLLAITGRALELVQRTWHPDDAAGLCTLVNVYARVSPSQKEWVVGALQGSGHSCAMLGDGSNDTGALKKAALGLAVLSNPELEARWDKARVEQAARRREARLNVQAMANAAPSARIMAARQAALANAGEEEDDGELEALLKSEQERTASLVQQYSEQGEGEGEGGLAESLTSSLLKTVEAKAAGGSSAQQAELAALKDRLKKLEQEAALEGGGMGTGPPVVSLGDASMAAPLTSKLPTPAAILEVLRQGRCTLVTTHQMFKILGTNALVQAYMMSVLHLANVRLGDYQATTVAMGAAACFMLISMAKPIRRLSVEKPRKSVFHPGLILSVLGQFAVHTCSLLLASALVGHNPWHVQPPTPEEMANYTAPAANLTRVQVPVADELIGADLLSSKLSSDSASLAAGAEAGTDAALGGGLWSLIFGESTPEPEASSTSTFKPSHVNTAVFLVYASAQACTFLASYYGPPFMAALREQTSLVRACGAMYVACILGALGLVPELNSWLQLLPLPDMHDRLRLAALIVVDGLACMGAEYAARAVDKWWYARNGK